MRKLEITKSEPKFDNLQLKCSNKIVASVVSKYAQNEIHFHELYQIGTAKWAEIETTQTKSNVIKFGTWFIQQEMLKYTCH